MNFIGKLVFKLLSQEKKSEALFFAIKNEDKKDIEDCINHGADVNSTVFGAHILTLAMEKNTNEEIWNLLLDKGADINHEVIYRETNMLGNPNIKVSGVSFLLKKGINPNKVDHLGYHPAFNYVNDSKEGLEKLKLLKQYGVDLKNTLNETTGENLLHECTVENIAEFLIQEGVNVNKTNKRGKTPIYTVKNSKIVSKLIDNGANLNHKDNNGETPLDQLLEDCLLNMCYNEYTERYSKSKLIYKKGGGFNFNKFIDKCGNNQALANAMKILKEIDYKYTKDNLKTIRNKVKPQDIELSLKAEEEKMGKTRPKSNAKKNTSGITAPENA